jgi:hypothetical protein
MPWGVAKSIEGRLILDSRVIIHQVWRNNLFLKAFHEGRDRCSVFGKSRLISSASVLYRVSKTPGIQHEPKGDVEHAVCTSWMVTESKSKSITSCLKSKEGAMRETIYNCYIDIVTRRKQPGELVAKVRMTHATWLRSRMNGNAAPCHARSELPPEEAEVQGR